jgi:hypothetical protein
MRYVCVSSPSAAGARARSDATNPALAMSASVRLSILSTDRSSISVDLAPGCLAAS